MKRAIRLVLGLALVGIAAGEERPDLLRLTDGQLEGTFAGLSPEGVLRWERDDGVDALNFQTQKIQQVVLGGSAFLPVGGSTSSIELVTGDQIPGRVTSVDAEALTLESEIVGPLTVPRDLVARISPNPFGGRLIYAGPFDPSAWEIRGPGGEAEEAEEAEEPEGAQGGESEGAEDAEPGSWEHLAGSWYYNQGNDALILDAPMPTSSVVRFRLDWRGTPSTRIAFYADFAEDPDPENRGARSSTDDANYFGNAFVMRIRSGYVRLYQTGYKEDGGRFTRTIRGRQGGASLRNETSANFELRTNLEEGFAALYIDGDFWIQWPLPNDPESLKRMGRGLGFRVLNSSARMRLSDLIIAEWNGMTDAASTLENRERDVVALTNGTDRFSGEVQGIRDGVLTLQGPYAPMEIPVADIAEIRFASDGRRQDVAEVSDPILIQFQPIGRLMGQPLEADAESIRLRSAILGELPVSLDTAKILEFRPGGSFLDAWNDDF
jgi:hypothetical protein